MARATLRCLPGAAADGSYAPRRYAFDAPLMPLISIYASASMMFCHFRCRRLFLIFRYERRHCAYFVDIAIIICCLCACYDARDKQLRFTATEMPLSMFYFTPRAATLRDIRYAISFATR